MNDRFFSLKQISERASICERTLRRYLGDIPHTRNGSRGKIRIRWCDFVRWMESRQVAIRSDDVVMDILREMKASRVN